MCVSFACVWVIARTQMHSSWQIGAYTWYSEHRIYMHFVRKCDRNWINAKIANIPALTEARQRSSRSSEDVHDDVDDGGGAKYSFRILQFWYSCSYSYNTHHEPNQQIKLGPEKGVSERWGEIERDRHYPNYSAHTLSRMDDRRTKSLHHYDHRHTTCRHVGYSFFLFFLLHILFYIIIFSQILFCLGRSLPLLLMWCFPMHMHTHTWGHKLKKKKKRKKKWIANRRNIFI